MIARYLLLSVTSRYCMKTAKHRISKATPHDSPGTLWVYDVKDIYEIPTGSPLPRSPPNADWAVKIAFFDRWRSLRLRRLTDENLCSSTTVVRVHDGAMVEEYVVSSTTLVVDEVCWSQLRYSWHQTRLVVWKSVDNTHVCDSDTDSRMLAVHVENYAGSRIQRGSCWKCSSGWHGICVHYLYNSRTTFQLKYSVVPVCWLSAIDEPLISKPFKPFTRYHSNNI